MSYLADPIPATLKTKRRAAISRARRTPRVLVVEDGTRLSEAIAELCDYLRVGVETVAGHSLSLALRHHRPMAILAEMDGASHDGCYVMMRVAEYDRTLPLMLLTGTSPALIGAAEAVEELWALSAVARHAVLPEIGEIVAFLFRAGQSGGCLGLLPM
jgi:CheY-like chemotaxis protein